MAQADRPVVPTVVVGTGYTGSRLLAALPGRQSIGYTRTPAAGDPRQQQLDLDQISPGAIALPADASVVYTVPPTSGSSTDLRLRRFLANIEPAPRRFVYLSTTGVYGDRGGDLVDETAQPKPASGRAARRAAAEAMLSNWASRYDAALVVLRVPGIYGPGRLGVDRIRERVPVLAEAETGPGNRIHVDDLVACILAALDDDVPPGFYNVGDGDHRSSTWFANEVARQLDLPPPPTISMDEAGRTFSAMRLSFLRESRRVDVGRMREVLAPELRYSDPVEGIAASLAEAAEEEMQDG